MDDSERRSLILVNPGLSPRRATVSTMYTAYRLNDANEVMPPHRHSPNAIRFGLTGNGNFTGVGGEDITFGPGDMVLTPVDTWHNHGNVGNEPAVNLSVLDLPLVETLNAVYFEHDYTEMVDGKPVEEEAADRDRAVRLFGPRLRSRRPAAALPFASSRRRALLADVRLSLGADAGTDRALQGLGRRSLRGDLDRIHRPADRRPGVQDHDLLRGQMLRPGERTRPLRQTASLLVAPFEGSGHSIIDGKRIDWHKFDNLAVPGGSWFEHHNGNDREPAILFVASDEPALKCFHLSRGGAATRPATSSRSSESRRRVSTASNLRPRSSVSCPSRSNTTLVSHFDCPGGGQVWVDGTTLYVGAHALAERHQHRRRGRPAQSAPAGAHRPSRGLAFAQGARRRRHHDRQPREARPVRAGRVRRRHRDLRRVAAERAEADQQVADRRARRAPLRFRRPLRVPVADRRGLRRQHRDDPRPRRSGAAGRGRAVVDPRPVEGGRRALSVGRLGVAALPPSAAPGRPPLCQLLAPRAVHPRHRRPVAAEADRAHQHQPGVSAPDPHVPADPAAAQGPPHHGGGGRGRRQAAPVPSLLHLDLRHHGGAAADADRDASRCRASTATAARSRR